MTPLPHLPSSHFSTFSSSATSALSQSTCFWGLIPTAPQSPTPTPPRPHIYWNHSPRHHQDPNCQTKSRRPQSSVRQNWKKSPWFQGPLTLQPPCSQLGPVGSAHLTTHVLLPSLAVLLPHAVLFCFLHQMCYSLLLIKPLHRRCSIQTSN